jgi:uncharacterized damage-inducible protein DinB
MVPGSGDSQMADSERYAAHIRSYTEGQDSLAMQENAPEILAKLIEGVADEALRAKPGSGKWSVAEILAHLADDEIVTSWRYRQMLENCGCALSGFDQDEWARMGSYASKGPRQSLQLFQLLRESNLQMLRRLTPEEWQRHGMHAERGRISVQDLARHMAGHDMNHVDQVRKILGKIS